MSISYNTLVSNYPTEDRPTLYNSLGGEWPSLISNPNYQNTCAVRLSIALRKSGVALPKASHEAMDNSGNPIVLKVATMQSVVKELLGDSTWGMSRQPGSHFDPSVIPDQKGIIVYHAHWKDATGHFDIWTGSDFYGPGNFQSLQENALDIELWGLE